METLDYPIFHVWHHFSTYDLMPKGIKKQLNIVILLLQMEGIELGLPAQEASALSITPLSLGWVKLNLFVKNIK